MNKVELLGRLTRDPETRYTQGDNSTAIIRFTVAVDRRFKKDGEQNADFISCVSFGKTAENIERFFNKGRRIAVVGRIQTGSYSDKEGKTVYTTDVVVEEFDFVDSANNNAAPSNNNGFDTASDGIDETLPFN